MKQNTASLSVSDYLLKSLWARCRLVGIINKVSTKYYKVYNTIIAHNIILRQCFRTICSHFFLKHSQKIKFANFQFSIFEN